MQGRINDIKAVIEGHLKVLQAIDTKKFDRSILEKSTPEKLFYLMQNSSKMKKELDKMAKGDQKDRLRMVSIIQSYNVADSPQF